MTSSEAFRCVQAWLLKKPAVWAEADVASLAAALMVQRPPARVREDALLQAERLHHRLRIAGLRGQLERSYELGERDLALLQMEREITAVLENDVYRQIFRRVALERRVEILEEENRNLRRRTH